MEPVNILPGNYSLNESSKLHNRIAECCITITTAPGDTYYYSDSRVHSAALPGPLTADGMATQECTESRADAQKVRFINTHCRQQNDMSFLQRL
jgi:hypothetical protein